MGLLVAIWDVDFSTGPDMVLPSDRVWMSPVPQVVVQAAKIGTGSRGSIIAFKRKQYSSHMSTIQN